MALFTITSLDQVIACNLDAVVSDPAVRLAIQARLNVWARADKATHQDQRILILGKHAICNGPMAFSRLSEFQRAFPQYGKGQKQTAYFVTSLDGWNGNFDYADANHRFPVSESGGKRGSRSVRPAVTAVTEDEIAKELASLIAPVAPAKSQDAIKGHGKALTGGKV